MEVSRVDLFMGRKSPDGAFGECSDVMIRDAGWAPPTKGVAFAREKHAGFGIGRFTENRLRYAPGETTHPVKEMRYGDQGR